MSDPLVSVQKVTKRFGETAAVDGVSLDVAPGELVTLLGPSGCGKTTLLRLVAGFERPDEGRVLIAGRDVTADPPHRREVHTVFQQYALFPHLTVARNVAFGLERKRLSRDEIARRVAEALDLVRLSGLEDRLPSQLSGGQQQRVAIARAVVLEPRALLLDEPLGALDRKLRDEMQSELKELQRRLGIAFVFVTHDQEEALSMSDRVVVMHAGRIEQEGAPREIYERPRTRFVAGFVGVTNLLERDAGGGPETIAVRPEKVRFATPGDGGALEGTIEEARYLGDVTHWRVRVGDALWTVFTQNDGAGAGPEVGSRVALRWEPEHGVPLER
jgi:ABC-type Fe3+/spermidine/putrescine transport system ATPase subunit